MLVLLVATLGTSTADAQDAPLTGIESVSILFEELDQDDTRCGLSDDDIRPAVANAFREGDVTVSDAPEPVVAYVGIATTVREDAELCASDYHISLMTRVEVAPPFAAESVSGLLSLTTEAGTVASARRDHPGRVTPGLSELARDLAGQIRLANTLPIGIAVEPPATTPEQDSAYRVARCQGRLSSPRLIPLETRLRDLEALQCQELVER
jgi:hypothetical protein